MPGREPQDRPTRETFDAAIRLLASDTTPEREPRVLEALGFALAHLDQPRGGVPLSVLCRPPGRARPPGPGA